MSETWRQLRHIRVEANYAWRLSAKVVVAAKKWRVHMKIDFPFPLPWAQMVMVALELVKEEEEIQSLYTFPHWQSCWWRRHQLSYQPNHGCSLTGAQWTEENKNKATCTWFTLVIFILATYTTVHRAYHAVQSIVGVQNWEREWKKIWEFMRMIFSTINRWLCRWMEHG